MNIACQGVGFYSGGPRVREMLVRRARRRRSGDIHPDSKLVLSVGAVYRENLDGFEVYDLVA